MVLGLLVGRTSDEVFLELLDGKLYSISRLSWATVACFQEDFHITSFKTSTSRLVGEQVCKARWIEPHVETETKRKNKTCGHCGPERRQPTILMFTHQIRVALFAMRMAIDLLFGHIESHIFLQTTGII